MNALHCNSFELGVSLHCGGLSYPRSVRIGEGQGWMHWGSGSANFGGEDFRLGNFSAPQNFGALWTKSGGNRQQFCGTARAKSAVTNKKEYRGKS